MDLEQKTYFLITGASRGIGQTMAIRVASKLKAGSIVVLLARNQEGLNKTKATIETSSNEALLVQTYAIDLGNASAQQFQELLRDSLAKGKSEAGDFERALIIHNAGSVGDVSKRAKDVSDILVWKQYYHINLFSVISLNCEFQRIFANTPKVVVNISSKCGVVPFASMSFYCSGKAARDMYFRVLATEEKEEDTLILNYAPGAIETDMTIIVQNDSVNEELTAEFKRMRDTKTMLTTEQTTEKFIKILEQRNFKSGDHVDYWD